MKILRELFVYLLVSFLLMQIVSCNAEKRSLKHIQKAERIEPGTVDKYFADNYHITDSVDTKIVYKQGEVTTDTIYQTETELINDTVFVTKLKTIIKSQVDTVYQDKVTTVRDGAKEADLTNKLSKSEKELATVTQQKKTWRSASLAQSRFILICLILWALKKWLFKR